MSRSIIIPPVRINAGTQAPPEMHGDALEQDDKLPAVFDKYATYNTRATWSALHRAVKRIEKLGRARHGSEPEVRRRGSSYFCRLSSFSRSMRPMNLLGLVDAVAPTASDIDVLLRDAGEHCVLELVIPAELFEDPNRRAVKHPRRRRRGPDPEAEDRFRAMDTHLSGLQPMRDIGAKSPSLKRSVMNVLGALNREMASCMLNADLLIKGLTETNVDLSVVFAPKPVDVRILQRTITRFGQCIRDMAIDVDRGACVIDFPVEVEAPRRMKKPKKGPRPAPAQLVDGATRINAHTVSFDGARRRRAGKKGWVRVHREPPRDRARPLRVQRKRRHAVEDSDEDVPERRRKRQRRARE